MPPITHAMKTCVFCGQPVRDPGTDRIRAREHVFPLWALEEFGIKREVIEFSTFEGSRDDGESLQLTEQTPIRSFDLNNFLLGAVCSICNNGWMSRLETRVQPDLRNLVRLSGASAHDRRGLAKWALKTACVLWRYLEPPVGNLPIGHARGLVGDGTTLPKQVAVFGRQSEDWRCWFSICMTFVVEAARDAHTVQQLYGRAYKVLLQLGHAQFLVQYFPLEGAQVAYDMNVCSLLAGNMSVVADDKIKLEGVVEGNAAFVLSNVIRPLSSKVLG